MTGMHQGLSAAAPLPSRSHPPLSKEELSTLHRSGTFYFALTETGRTKVSNSEQVELKPPQRSGGRRNAPVLQSRDDSRPLGREA